MDSAIAGYIIGWIIGFSITLGIGALVTFWVVRGAILSALAEDRRRVADEQRFLAMEEERQARKAAKKAAKRESELPGR